MLQRHRNLHPHCRSPASCCTARRCAVKPCAAIASRTSSQVDVVVVGAGIIGLLTAEALLKQNLSVALVERKQLCAGATGAGQGYIWMAHRSPSTAMWGLASDSLAEWRKMMREDPSLRDSIEWQDTGSMLLATTPEEAVQLQARQALLQQHGVLSRFVGATELRQLEPALSLQQGHGSGGEGGGGALIAASDAQINGRQTAHTLLSRCSSYSGLHLMLDEPVERLVLQPSSSCSTGVQTGGRVVGARLGTVVAAGAWSGGLVTAATGQSCWAQLLQPRRGHLLEVQPPRGMPPLRHGIMEMSYTKHYATQATGMKEQKQQTDGYSPAGQAAAALSDAAGATRPGAAAAAAASPAAAAAAAATLSAAVSPAPAAAAAAPAASAASSSAAGNAVDITFTATTSASGSLLIGSSREFSGWGNEPSPEIIQAIMTRARQFLPYLEAVPLPVGSSVRVGLRPYASGGLPLVGPVPGFPGLFMAAGHEGSGLTLGPATAQLLCGMLLNDESELAKSQRSRLMDLLPEQRALAL